MKPVLATTPQSAAKLETSLTGPIFSPRPSVENPAAAANFPVIDDDKTSKRRNPIVIIDHHRRARLNCQPANFIALELLAFLLCRFERRRIHHLIDRNDFALHVLRREAQIVE